MEQLFIYMMIIAILSAKIILYRIPTLVRQPATKSFRKSISIIVPVRNEEKNLPHLLASIQKQTLKPDEIIVVDDDSTDQTPKIARDFGARVISLPEQGLNWVGKSAGCYVGAKEASTEWIYFIDADIMLPHEDSLYTILKAYENQNGQGILSIQPFHKITKFYENFSVIFNLLVFAGMNRFSILQNRLEAGGAFGPSLLVNRMEYFELGGHLSVKNQIMENIALGRLFLKNEKTVLLYGGEDVLHFRMYPDGFLSLFQGWTKSFASGSASTHPALLMAISFWIAGSFISLIGVIYTSIIANRNLQIISLILYTLYGLQFYNMAKKVGNFNRLMIWLHPLYLIFFVVTFVYSFIQTFFVKSVSWKGRKVDL